MSTTKKKGRILYTGTEILPTIEHAMLDRKISKKELAAATRMSLSSLYNKFKNPRSFTVGELILIMAALGISSIELGEQRAKMYEEHLMREVTVRCRETMR